MTYRKKLIEVALPLKAINEASAREKSIRHGHPSTLHLWWARRPLAACRAVLFASLVDDPDSDPMYAGAGEEIAGAKRAELFNLIEELVQWENSNNPRVINRARAEIARSIAANKVADGEWTNETVLCLAGATGSCGESNTPTRSVSEERKLTRSASEETSRGANKAASPLPDALPRDLADASGWCDEAKPSMISVSVRDVKNMLAAPEAVNAFLAEHAPPVLDPFCGGGSIPLEAQRLGLRAYASDLNPVPVLITKALIEIPPKFAGRPPVNPEWQQKSPEEKSARVWQGAQGLAEDVRYYGKWMRDEAEKRIGHLYPKVKITADMAQDRPDLKEYVGQELTVIAWLWARTVECPNPGCRARMPLVRSFILSKKERRHARIVPVVDREQTPPMVTYRVKCGAHDGVDATMHARNATCVACGASVPLDYVRSRARQGGMMGSMIAIVAEGARERVYLSPTDCQEAVARAAMPIWKPDELVTTPCHDVDRLPMYGMRTWGDVFTERQATGLSNLSDLVQMARQRVAEDSVAAFRRRDRRRLIDGGVGGEAYGDAIATYLALLVDKITEASSTICTWSSSTKNELVVSTFRRHVLPMTWDFAEGNPFGPSSGSIDNTLHFVAKTIADLPACSTGHTQQLDATAVIDTARVIVSTGYVRNSTVCRCGAETMWV